MVAEPPALPGDHCTRLDEEKNVPPAGPGSGQPRPEQAIGDLDARSRGTPLEDGELVAQRKDLQLQGGSRPDTGTERSKEREEDRLHGGKEATPLVTPDGDFVDPTPR